MRTYVSSLVVATAIVRFGSAQVVQLPTVAEFSVNTTVSAPDGGGIYLGGVNRGGMSSVQRGLGPLARNRAIGSSIGASSAWAHVRIIDPKEEEARRFPDLAEKAAAAQRSSEEAHLARRATTGEAPLESVATIKARLAEEDERLEVEAAEHFNQGESARKLGKWAAARSYYLLAAKKSKGELKGIALQLAEEMKQSQTAQLQRRP